MTIISQHLSPRGQKTAYSHRGRETATIERARAVGGELLYKQIRLCLADLRGRTDIAAFVVCALGQRRTLPRSSPSTKRGGCLAGLSGSQDSRRFPEGQWSRDPQGVRALGRAVRSDASMTGSTTMSRLGHRDQRCRFGSAPREDKAIVVWIIRQELRSWRTARHLGP